MPESRDHDSPQDTFLRHDGAPGSGAASGDPAFDRWLSRRLHETYDSVLKEELPDELDRLVRQIVAKEDASKTEADGHRDGGKATPPRRCNGSAADRRQREPGSERAPQGRRLSFFFGSSSALRG